MLTAPWRHILKEVYRGRSIGRALIHHQVSSHVTLIGNVLDIGGGHRNTYLEYMDLSKAKSFVVIDIQPTPIVQVVGSVTNMPIRSKSIDTVLCFNLLEHVFDYEAALSEIHRVMKPGAVLYGWVPFIMGVHGDPHDYWRYTPTALEQLLRNARLKPLTIEGCGDAFLSGFDLVRQFIRFWYIGRVIRVLCTLLALTVSWMFNRIYCRGTSHYANCPLGIWFSATRE